VSLWGGVKEGVAQIIVPLGSTKERQISKGATDKTEASEGTRRLKGQGVQCEEGSMFGTTAAGNGKLDV